MLCQFLIDLLPHFSNLAWLADSSMGWGDLDFLYPARNFNYLAAFLEVQIFSIKVSFNPILA